MSDYFLENELDSRVFLFNHSKIEGRLDPMFYVAVKAIEDDIVSKSKYPCDSLIKSCSLKRGRFGHRPRNDPRFYGGEYPFIQTGDIVKAAENNGRIEYTQTLNEKGLATSRLFEPPQLLFTIAANIGDTAILDYPSCFPDSIVSITPHSTEDISLDYLNVYLKLIKPYVVELAPYSAQRNLNNQQLAQVPIIIPPSRIQEKIVSIAEAAYGTKTLKEQLAKDLLASIDGYLLEQLGITLPEKDNSLEKRVFKRWFTEVTGGRFDPKLYDNYTKNLRNAIASTRYATLPLKNLVVHSASGDWGKDPKVELGDAYQKCLVIRAAEFDNSFNLAFSPEKNRFRLISKDKLRRLDIQENDLLLEKSGGSPDQPVGRVALLTNEVLNDNTICYSNFLHKIRVDKTQVLPSYLFAFLKTVHNIKLTDAMQSQTNGIRNLIMSNYFDQLIPLPDTLDMQKEIADHISDIRTRAADLQSEALKALEKANAEIEKLILES